MGPPIGGSGRRVSVSQGPGIGQGTDGCRTGIDQATRARRERGARWCGRRRPAATPAATAPRAATPMRPGARRSVRRAPSCRAALPERARQSATGSSRRRASPGGDEGRGIEPAPAGAAGHGRDRHDRLGGLDRPRRRVRGDLRRHQLGQRQRAAELQRAHELQRRALIGERRPGRRERGAGRGARPAAVARQGAAAATRSPSHGRLAQARRAERHRAGRQGRAAGEAERRGDEGGEVLPHAPMVLVARVTEQDAPVTKLHR